MDSLLDPAAREKAGIPAAERQAKAKTQLLAELSGYRDDPPIELLDEELFDRRLQQFGYPPDPLFSFERLNGAGVISTFDPRGSEI